MDSTFHFSPAALHTRLLLHAEYPIIDAGVVIADARVAGAHQRFFETIKVPMLLIRGGETNKTAWTINRIHAFLADVLATRDTVMHAIGGGVVCDLAAYAASTYKRGMRLHLYPSTLMAMVDAALGGKCGYNLGGVRNLIGTFYPAAEVKIHPTFLSTLNKAQLRQGWAEMIKLYHVIPSLPDLPIPTFLIPDDDTILSYASHKLQICVTDLHDNGKRRLLNLGHSFAHALESAYTYRIGHGDAVTMGMMMAADTSHRLGLIDTRVWQEILSDLQRYPLPRRLLSALSPVMQDKFRIAFAHDKKHGKERMLILFHGWRDVRVHAVPHDFNPLSTTL